MSLINTMLNDLDRRQTYRPEPDDDFLNGLEAADTALQGRRQWRSRLHLLGLLVLGLSLLVLTGQAWTPKAARAGGAHDGAAHETATAPRPTQSLAGALDRLERPLEVGSNASVAALAPAAAHDHIQTVLLEASANPVVTPVELKLALSMADPAIPQPALTSVAGASDGVRPSLDGIDVSDDFDSALITLGLSAKPEYVLYTLMGPPRTVLDLRGTTLEAVAPGDFHEGNLLSGVRTRSLPDGTLRVVFDLNQSADIAGASVVANDDRHQLNVRLIRTAWEETPFSPHEGQQVAWLSDQAPIAKTSSDTTAEAIAQRHYREALNLVHSGRVTAAEESLRQALESHAEHVQARLLLATKLVEQRREDEAADILEAGLALAPSDARLARFFARLEVRSGNIARALEVLQGAAPELPGDPEYHAFMAALLQRTGQHAAAVAIYREVLVADPDNGVWWMGLAISLESVERTDEAILAYQRALRAPSLKLELKQYIEQRVAVLRPQPSS